MPQRTSELVLDELLPNDVFGVVIGFLGGITLLKCSLLSKEWYHYVLTDVKLAKEVVERDYTGARTHRLCSKFKKFKTAKEYYRHHYDLVFFDIPDRIVGNFLKEIFNKGHGINLDLFMFWVFRLEPFYYKQLFVKKKYQSRYVKFVSILVKEEFLLMLQL